MFITTHSLRSFEPTRRNRLRWTGRRVHREMQLRATSRSFAMLTRDAEYTEKGKYDSDRNSETAEFRSHSVHLRCRRTIFIPAGPAFRSIAISRLSETSVVPSVTSAPRTNPVVHGKSGRETKVFLELSTTRWVRYALCSI